VFQTSGASAPETRFRASFFFSAGRGVTATHAAKRDSLEHPLEWIVLGAMV
jgi:hypothetical protein